MALELYRRHTPRCKEAKRVAKLTGRREGRDVKKCECPWWVDGFVDGKRIRRSTGTRDKRKAQKKLDQWEGNEPEKPEKPESVTIATAIARFEVRTYTNLRDSTKRKYGNILRQLVAFCGREGIRTVAEFTADHFDDFRAQRNVAEITKNKELQTLRQFFQFCQHKKRRWIADDPTEEVRATKWKSNVAPYTPGDVAAILAACNEFGRRPYERLRARAMVLLLRHTGLRISDVALMRRDRIQGNQIFLRAIKNDEPVYLPLAPEVLDALAMLPPPSGSPQVSEYFFWNGVTSERAAVGIAERTLAAVFKKSGVPNAHSHRFRHTLATAILARGGTEQDAADILGISPAIVRKHYAKWSPARQDRITKLMAPDQPIAGTLVVQTDEKAVIQ